MKKLKPICDSCPSGEFNAIFDSINDKQRVHQAGRMSNFYNFLIIDENNKPIWNPDKQDYMFAGVQANTPSAGRYRHAKIHELPRILTPSQFLNYQDNRYGCHVYDFPTMEMLLEIAKENQLTWRIRVEYKDLKTSSFSKITHIINPRTQQWEATDCVQRGRKTRIYERIAEEHGLEYSHINDLRKRINEAKRIESEFRGEDNGNTNIN